MSAQLTLYKDSARTQPLDAGTAWGTYLDLGTTDITSVGTHVTADVGVWMKNTGDRQASNVYLQAAPAALTTLAAAAAATTSLTVASASNLSVGMALDIATPIADPGASADYAYPLTPTYKSQNVVITAIVGTTVTVSAAVTAASGDALYTSGTLAILGQVQVAPDSAGSPGAYGAQGAAVNVAAGPLTALTGTSAAWVKGNWPNTDSEGTHKFGLHVRCTSG